MSDGRSDGWRGRLPSPAASYELTRIDLLRGARWLRGEGIWMLFLLVTGAFCVFIGWLLFTASRTAAETMVTGGEPAEWLVLGVGVVWVFLTGFLTLDAAGSNGELDHDGHYLTRRSVADVAGGKLLAAACKFAVYAVGFAVAVGGGFVAGTGRPTAALGVFAAAVVATATATAVGYPLGLASRGIARRSTRLAIVAKLLGGALFIAYLVLSITGEMIELVLRARPALTAPPLTWLADLAFLSVPGSGAPLSGAIAAVLFGGFVTLLGTLAAIPAARYAWLADTARPADADVIATEPPAHGFESLLRPLSRSPAALAVASTTLLRTVRALSQLIFVAPPLLGAIPLAEGLFATGTLPWYAPWAVVWYGAWAAGTALALNPLGSQGGALTTLLLAPARGRAVVAGYVVAATAPVAPVTALVAVAAATRAETAAPLLLAPAAVVAVAAGAVVAVGIGTVFPRFETMDLTGGTSALPPSKVAYVLFSGLATLLVVAVATITDDLARTLVAVLLSRLRWVHIAPETVELIAWLVVGGCVVAVPLAYRTAVRRIDGFTLA